MAQARHPFLDHGVLQTDLDNTLMDALETRTAKEESEEQASVQVRSLFAVCRVSRNLVPFSKCNNASCNWKLKSPLPVREKARSTGA